MSENGSRPAAPRVVVIIGGSSGIGLAAAIRLVGRGDTAVLAARSERALETAAALCRAEGPGTVEVAVTDINERAQVEHLVTSVAERHGRIDGVVHTAAVMAYGSIEDLPAETLEQVIATDVFGTANVARALLPLFRRQGHGVLVAVNSVVGSVTVPQMGAYAVAKWAQRALLRTLQQETRGDKGTHVCIVSPGSVNTPIYYLGANYLGRETRPPFPVRSADQLADTVVRVLDRPRRHVSFRVGVTNPIITAGYRLLPALYDALVGPLFRLAALGRRPTPETTGNVHEPRPELERVQGRWPAPDDAAASDLGVARAAATRRG